jgi:predicted dinucleotide-binding enzyme
MPRIAVLGASGPIGRRVARRLVDAGHDVVLVGRHADRLAALAADLGGAAQHPLDADASAPSLRAALAEVELGVSALPVTDGVAGRALEAAVAEAVHLVDTVDVQAHLAHAYDELHGAAHGSGTVVVPGVGWRTATGDLLAALAAERVLAPRAVHVAATVPDRGGVLRAASPGTRRGLAATLGRPIMVFEEGQRAEELLGETRRLAWFPRPYGPRHAAGAPGLEPLSVPLHLPQVRTVRSYVAVPSTTAELLQAAGNLARWEPARRRLVARLERGARRPRPDAIRWAVVAEVEGEDGVARGWANGHDADLATALLVEAVVASILAGQAEPGVIPPARAGRPRELLDAVAGASSVRWSVSRPRG